MKSMVSQTVQLLGCMYDDNHYK